MTTTDRSTVVGVFEIRSQADDAIHDLQQAGFHDDQIGFVVRNGDEDVVTPPVVERDEVDTGGGAAAGAVSGGIIGGIVGAAAALLVPGVGPAIAGGILIAILGGVVFGAAAGGILGALTNLGVPEEEARYYEGEFSSGRTIVMVKADGRQQEATTILHRNGGYNADRRFVQVPAQAPIYAPDGAGVTTIEEGGESNMQQPQPQNQPGQPQYEPVQSQPQPVQQPQSVQAPLQPQSTPMANTNESSRTYDPIIGVGDSQQQGQSAPVSPASYGQQRDPSVETDTTAGTTDTQVRPDSVVDEGADKSFYERPVEPGTVQSGSMDDPNARVPRIP